MNTHIVGTGPSELRAHIDLDRKVAALGNPRVSVLEISEADGHWSVLAEVQDEMAGEGR